MGVIPHYTNMFNLNFKSGMFFIFIFQHMDF